VSSRWVWGHCCCVAMLHGGVSASTVAQQGQGYNVGTALDCGLLILHAVGPGYACCVYGSVADRILPRWVLSAPSTTLPLLTTLT
jgi:hypothetical protein